jgi:hydrogenase maturation factor
VTSPAVGLRSAIDSSACAHDHCITCSDEAVPMTVLSIDRASGLAICTDPDGATRCVETALVEELTVGSSLLVHADVAIAPAGGTE